MLSATTGFAAQFHLGAPSVLDDAAGQVQSRPGFALGSANELV